MSSRPFRIEIPPGIEAQMTPKVKPFIYDVFSQDDARLAELEEKIQKLTPRNSSRPPSSEHLHAKPNRKKRTGKRKNRGASQDIRWPVAIDRILPKHSSFPSRLEQYAFIAKSSGETSRRHPGNFRDRKTT